MNGNITQEEIKKELFNEFSDIGTLFGLNTVDIREGKSHTSVYLIGINALELEIDWRENALFMYVVYLIDGKLPDENTIYKYDDGTLCRIYIDDLYQIKNPVYQSGDRTSPYFLVALFQHYKRLIKSNPNIISPYFEVDLNA